MTIAGELAQFFAETSFTDLPPLAVERAAMLIASTIASAAMGAEISSSRIIRSLARQRGGTPEASIWFEGGAKLPVADVARANAMMSDAAASDDSDLRNIVHPGTTLAATALALAERTGATGRQALAAMVLGYEAAGRIGAAVTPAFRARGFHGCLIAIFGGGVAAGKLLQLDAQQLAQTIALSATSIGGLMAAANTSVAREYHAGLAAMLGVNAALAAQQGYLAEERVLEMREGFFDVYGGVDVEGVTRDLGQEWDIITEMGIKLVPGGHPHHALAEAAANAARAGNVSPDAVERITLSRPGVLTLTGPTHPTTLIEVAHSPAYFLAAGVADKDFSWVHASPEKIADPVIRGLLDKVQVGEQPRESAERYRQGATVTVTTRSGNSYTSTVYAPKGSAPRGIAWDDVDTKYRTLVPLSGLDARRVEDSLRVIHAFERVQSAAELLDLLH